jgi:hypothetical protein
MKLLLELRPALDGHAGIPQETRLLFAGLAGLPGLQVQGLIQSSSLPIDRGLPLRDGRIDPAIAPDRRIDRLSKVVVSMQPAVGVNALENLRRRLRRYGGPLRAAAGSLVGLREPLSGFDATHFQDFIWRTLFARTLPLAHFDTVTACDYRILGLPYGVTATLGALSGFLGHAVFPRIDTRGTDILLAETPYPGIPARGTRLVVRYHDAVPLLMPHTIKNRAQHRAAHFHALRRNARDGAWFACVSDATRADLLSVLPELEPRAVTIPNMVLERPESEIADAGHVPEIIWSRKNRAAPEGGGAPLPPEQAARGAPDYLLMVSTLEPRKNHAALLDAWEMLRSRGHPALHLVCVGGMGWQHEDIIGRFRPWLARGGVHLLSDVPAADLRTLYRHARATVCPSFSEGFDYSGVEAMQCGGAVVASDIRVHRDVFGHAAEYFNPYSAPELAAALERVIGPPAAARRAALVADGAAVAARYRPQVVLPLWQAFLERVMAA